MSTKPHKIRFQHNEEADCNYCGCPLMAGDNALQVGDEYGEIYCSRACYRSFMDYMSVREHAVGTSMEEPY